MTRSNCDELPDGELDAGRRLARRAEVDLRNRGAAVATRCS